MHICSQTILINMIYIETLYNYTKLTLVHKNGYCHTDASYTCAFLSQTREHIHALTHKYASAHILIHACVRAHTCTQILAEAYMFE